MLLRGRRTPATEPALLIMARPFPLTPVLRLREQKEEAEERALIAINADLQQVRVALARVEGEMARFGAVRQEITRAVITAAHHQMLALQWRSLQEAHAQLRVRMQSLVKSRAEQQQSFIFAKRQRETLSELRQQYKDRIEKEAEQSERKRIDDLFSSRHARAVAHSGRHTADTLKKLNEAHSHFR